MEQNSMFLNANRNVLLVLFALTLPLTALACNLPYLAKAATPPPIPVSTQAAEELATQVAAAAATAMAGGPIVLEFSEAQLTSAIALELQQRGETRLQDVQVRLRDGQVFISGKATQGGFSLPLNVALRITVNAQGLPQTEVVQATLGPLPLPAEMINELTERLNRAIIDEVQASGSNLYIESLTIDNGMMRIVANSR